MASWDYSRKCVGFTACVKIGSGSGEGQYWLHLFSPYGCTFSYIHRPPPQSLAGFFRPRSSPFSKGSAIDCMERKTVAFS
jgi:hypothetical protein